MLLDATGKPQAVMAQPSAGIAACQRSTTGQTRGEQHSMQWVACKAIPHRDSAVCARSAVGPETGAQNRENDQNMRRGLQGVHLQLLQGEICEPAGGQAVLRLDNVQPEPQIVLDGDHYFVLLLLHSISAW